MNSEVWQILNSVHPTNELREVTEQWETGEGVYKIFTWDSFPNDTETQI